MLIDLLLKNYPNSNRFFIFIQIQPKFFDYIKISLMFFYNSIAVKLNEPQIYYITSIK